MADGEQMAKLEKARDAVGLLNDLVWVLGLLALATAIASVIVAPRRGAALKRLGIGLALVVVVIAVAVALTRRAFVDAATQTVPSGVAGSFFDAMVNSIRFASPLGVRARAGHGPPRRHRQPAVLRDQVGPPDPDRRRGAGSRGRDGRPAPTWAVVLAILIAVAVAEIILEIARRRGLAADPPAHRSADQSVPLTAGG